MTKTLRIILGVFLVGLIVNTISNLVDRNSNTKSPLYMSKSEYLTLAVNNCSKTNPESYCKCFYADLLDKHTVEEVLKIDADAVKAGDNYEVSDEMILIAANCVE